ncbi:GFA family protein [Variovorax sp. J22R133]|uniref:GFA family protein n=1 Tax=Variovorax brevis TaxID=3053503 RepID=UPI0025749BDC|nr:GFA family protein [Variovorax sp. J22R133]MDM0116191.1 GFA family protein [Variovorax sp. J22R133]
MGTTLKGHCFCGAVRYEAGGVPSNETNCHCSICRRTSGAPFVAWFTVPSSGFRLTAGRPATFKSSEHGTRSFCAACGTPLTFHSTKYPDEMDVTTCSLEDPAMLPPRDHTRTSSRLPWVHLDDGLPAYPEARPA